MLNSRICVCEKLSESVTQMCLALCDLMDHNLPSSSVHGILQARILGWVAILFSRGFPNAEIEVRSPEMKAYSLPLSHQRSI